MLFSFKLLDLPCLISQGPGGGKNQLLPSPVFVYTAAITPENKKLTSKQAKINARGRGGTNVLSRYYVPDTSVMRNDINEATNVVRIDRLPEQTRYENSGVETHTGLP